MSSGADFDELLAILDLEQRDEDTFIGVHPSKNPVRTFGGQMMAQAFTAAGRTLKHPLPPSAMSVHFIAGGDPDLDLELQVVRLRDERRFANRRVDVMQKGQLLTSAMISYLAGGRGLEHGVPAPPAGDPLAVPPIDDLLRGYDRGGLSAGDHGYVRYRLRHGAVSFHRLRPAGSASRSNSGRPSCPT